MDELMEGQTNDGCNFILSVFARAHRSGMKSTGAIEHARSVTRLEERRVALLGAMERFRDQGEA
eukprot:CAMPEP_0180229590 /NCGR_PEP_ID=MMETSP0987-20121128/25628_1 /TAXON_ID=697907 /ORGANISM="non described non described, Strain CCMP2293" /LENGTH=63 /DNA_ID=CAMNT_0022194361 /DNA_START=15 /DNA_END=203 /DNA_ORIENTATION=-